MSYQWQTYAVFDEQMNNWVRWSRAALGKPSGVVVPLAKYEKDCLNYIERDTREPIYERDAMHFDDIIRRLPRRQIIIIKLHYLDRFAHYDGKIEYPKSLGQKLRLVGVGKTTFYAEVGRAESAIKRIARFDRELQDA